MAGNGMSQENETRISIHITFSRSMNPSTCKTQTHHDSPMNSRILVSSLVSVLLSASSLVRAGDTVRYYSQHGSKVQIKGTSTIHDWTMDSDKIGGSLEVDPGFPESALKDAKAARPVVQAIMPVTAFKSYAKRMDEIMQEHMKVTEFRRIEYKLIELKPKAAEAKDGKCEFDAVGALTIAGVTVTNTMPVVIEKTEGNRLKVSGSTPLKMTTFNVQPPAPTIAGMPTIKTGDDITIIFEWISARKAEAK